MLMRTGARNKCFNDLPPCGHIDVLFAPHRGKSVQFLGPESGSSLPRLPGRLVDGMVRICSRSRDFLYILPYGFAIRALAACFRRALAEQSSTPAERRLIDNVTKRVRLWKEVKPYIAAQDMTARLPSRAEPNRCSTR